MKKNGFTLIELVAVILILALLALVVFPTIGRLIKKSKESTYQEQINYIESAANNWLVANSVQVNKESYKCLSVSELKNSGFLKNEKIINPVDNKEINGYVRLTYNSSYDQYEKEYVSSCDGPFTINETVLKTFPEIELGTNGCKIANASKNYTYMGGCYLKGAQTKNYLWYSGFLWRIMGINADETIRLITEENVTAIPYNVANNTNFKGSHVDSWLNEYFYNNLRGTDIIVSNNFCQGVATTNSTSSRIDCTGGTTLNKKVGLISLDEYNLAGGSSSYLMSAQNFWTIIPNNVSNEWYIGNNGSINSTEVGYTRGVRAIVNINSVFFITGGNGTLSNIWTNEVSPYILNENKSASIIGLLKDKSTPGEYVNLANKIYRVVSNDNNGNTKLMLDGYYQETAGTNYTSVFGTNNTFTTASGIGQKLNSDVLNFLIPASDMTNRNKLVNNYNWYQNNFDLGNSYTVSLNETTPTLKTQATVGLIRVGEMLSSQSYTILTKSGTVVNSYSNAADYWTITPFNTSLIEWRVTDSGNVFNNDVSYTYALRPLIVVNSSVNIINGNGTPSSPYEI